MEAGRSVLHNTKIYFAPFGSNQICCYSVEDGEWTDHGKPMYYINPGLAIIHGCVAAIGGQRNNKLTNEVRVWKDESWVKYKSMRYKKSDPAVVTVTITSTGRKYVIAISGKCQIPNALPWTANVEVYDVDENEWKEVSPLPSPYPRVETTLCKDMIYVFPDQYHKAFKCDLTDLVRSTGQQNTWKSFTNFPLRYSTPATLGDRVVCVGGADETKDGQRDVYEYNAEEDEWENIGVMKEVGRMYAMVEICEDTFVVVGGVRELTDRDPSHCLKIVETFTKTDLLPKEKEKAV